jgi:phytanoyl-CoA hydroxylase
MTMRAPIAHERNTSFTWREHAGPFRAITAEQAGQYDENGYFVLEDALGAGEVDALIGAIDPFEERQADALRKLEGGRFFIARADEITFTTHLVMQSPVLRDFTLSVLLTDVCADLIGPDVRLYWDQAVYKKPGTESPFPWHQDNGYAFVEPQQYLTCWVALTDATEDNGCPWVVPGLHRRGTLAHEYSDIGFVCLRDPDDAVAVPARAGSIVVFSSLTPHSTGPNRTGDVRKSYIVQYAPSGAEVVQPERGGEESRIRADAQGRQYEVLRQGRRVTR